MMQRALILSRSGQCGRDTAKTRLPDVQAVDSMDRPVNYEHADLSESSLYSAFTLNLHGLPYEYSSFQSSDLPTSCPSCNAALTNPLEPDSHHVRMSMWQSHLGRRGRDGRCLQAHEVVNLSIKRLALSIPDPGGVAIPSGYSTPKKR